MLHSAESHGTGPLTWPCGPMPSKLVSAAVGWGGSASRVFKVPDSGEKNFLAKRILYPSELMRETTEHKMG